jgi:hypothetical protein
VRVVQTPIQAPNANTYAERFVRSIRAECLDRLIVFGKRRLRHVVDQFVAHYHGERNHQGLGNELIAPQCHQNAARTFSVASGSAPTALLPSRGLTVGGVFGHYEFAGTDLGSS